MIHMRAEPFTFFGITLATVSPTPNYGNDISAAKDSLRARCVSNPVHRM